MSEAMWIERAQSAEAKLKTLKDAYEPAIERIKTFKANLGIKERGNGEIVIDYQRFVERLGPDAAAELLQVIHEKYGEIGRNVTATEVSKPKRKYVRKAKLEAVHA